VQNMLRDAWASSATPRSLQPVYFRSLLADRQPNVQSFLSVLSNARRQHPPPDPKRDALQGTLPPSTSSTRARHRARSRTSAPWAIDSLTPCAGRSVSVISSRHPIPSSHPATRRVPPRLVRQVRQRQTQRRRWRCTYRKKRYLCTMSDGFIDTMCKMLGPCQHYLAQRVVRSVAWPAQM